MKKNIKKNIKEKEIKRKETSYSPCKGCAGGFRCWNPNAYSYMQFCGTDPRDNR